MKKLSIFAFTLLVVTIIWYLIFNQMHTSNQVIRVGLNNSLGSAFFYLAKQKDFYNKLGIDVEILQYDSLLQVKKAFEKGKIDIMHSTIIEFLLLQNKTLKKPKVFFVSDFSNGRDVILSNKYIDKTKRLKNKKIAVEPKSLGLYLISRALQLAKISGENVKIISMDQSEMLKAMQGSEVDAVVTYPPVSTQIENEMQDINTIFSSQNIPGEIINIVSADEYFINNNTQKMYLLLKAWDMAVQYSIDNPKDAYSIMSNREGILKQDLFKVRQELQILRLQDQKYSLQEKGTLEKALWFSIEIFKRLGYIKDKIIVEQLINRSPIEVIEK